MAEEKIEKEVARRRSFAIIAHPDAGKTTLTEKLLLYGGAIHLAGHVRAKKDRKSTRSDWMTMEQERGISVSTTSLQFEYNAHILNLLDTPGHEDFSEDTYRTLMAVDFAVMTLDGGKGVEPQTIKLFQICRERNIPIFTFINKMDMPARSPFELLDEVEKVLGITAVPMVWPMGSGRDFRGYYDLNAKKVSLFEKTTGGAFRAPEKVSGLDDPELISAMDEQLYATFKEEVQISQEAILPFSIEEFKRGAMTPVYFGSAITNFGVQFLLDEFIRLAPSPSPVLTDDGNVIAPTDSAFTAFVFKLQANMNRQHRDRVAFVRIVSGKFERGMTVKVPRLNKEVKLTSPVAFFGQERNTVDIAWAGDIIGLINPGTYRIGDVLCTGDEPKFNPLPKFAPDIFAKLVSTDTSKLKQFRKGLTELSEEGVVQVFNPGDQTPILGAVGQLQFEVFKFRLEDEYGAKVRLESTPFECSRWVKEQDLEKFSRFDSVVRDERGNPVILFESQYRMQNFMNQHPEVLLSIHPPL
ncbi:MAG: peptide chain release factor 3 [Leptospiraceae bacterium]|nr:peptide chain release factor 3 [Leptospiraceae bacterium]